ncbi:hypothetical protein C3L33_17817, partial [Rhododendron williamsianum]
MRLYLHCSQTYNITVSQARVGTTLVDLDLTALFDSGTSFTYLVDPAYSWFSESFIVPTKYDLLFLDDAQPRCKHQFDTDFFCAYTKMFSANDLQHELIYCLAFVKSAELNIIGRKSSLQAMLVENFMTGYRVVFDKEKLILGWKKSNCYDIEDADTFWRGHTTLPLHLQLLLLD